MLTAFAKRHRRHGKKALYLGVPTLFTAVEIIWTSIETVRYFISPETNHFMWPLLLTTVTPALSYTCLLASDAWKKIRNPELSWREIRRQRWCKYEIEFPDTGFGTLDDNKLPIPEPLRNERLCQLKRVRDYLLAEVQKVGNSDEYK